uniref:Reverse transcriptase n=1 Tax=Rhipicephalus appendiculatus TaxID=34631 RepID=A0A131YW51_RHIAP
MDALEKLTAIGLQLGFSGAELNKWIEAQQAKLRDERAEERDAAKEADERQREILQLKLKLQEGAKNMPVAATDALPAPSTSSPINPQKLLPLFDEKRDDLHAYLQRFERVATGQDWPQEKWGLAVSMCLTGDALTVIGRMTAADSLDYQKVKKALLQRFQFTAQGYQEKFRKARAADGETGRQFAARVTSYFDHWIDMANVPKTFDGLRDHVIAEQFLRSCHPKLVVFLKERECKSLDELASFTDRFLEAQNLPNLGKSPEGVKDSGAKPTETSRKPQLKCILCHRLGHLAPDCRTPPKQMLKCKLCGKMGHAAETCQNQHGDNKPSSSCACTESEPTRARPRKPSKRPGGKVPCLRRHDDENLQDAVRFLVDGMPVVEGLLLEREVRVLLDTGCNTAIVRRELVPDVCLTGKKISVALLDGSTSHLPEAVVQVNTPYFTGMLKVACMDQPLYDLVLGNLPGVRGPYDPDSDWKQAARTQVDELPVEAHTTKSPGNSSVSSSVVKAKSKQQGQDTIKPLYVSTSLLPDVTRAQLVEEQRKDPTLKAIFAKINREFKSGKGHSYKIIEDKGLFYRHYRLANGRTFKQVVTPKAFRQGILDIAHGSIMAGHQGIKRTTDRVLEEFYWPDLNGDVKRFVKSCDKCQRTTPKGKVGVAPLGNMPLIRAPFERVAVDGIGPFSTRSDHGNVLNRTYFSTDVKLSPNLTAEQVRSLQTLFPEYAGIFPDLPGKTALVECSLRLTSETPVHVARHPQSLAKQYRKKKVQDMAFSCSKFLLGH